MPESGTSGSVGAGGGKPPSATRPVPSSRACAGSTRATTSVGRRGWAGGAPVRSELASECRTGYGALQVPWPCETRSPYGVHPRCGSQLLPPRVVQCPRPPHRPGVGTGRQAGFRFLCPDGRVGSNPTLGTINHLVYGALVRSHPPIRPGGRPVGASRFPAIERPGPGSRSAARTFVPRSVRK